MLLVFVAAQQGWTLREAREQPVEDLQLLAAHYVMEGEEVKKRSSAAGKATPGGAGGRGGHSSYQVTDKLRFVNPNYRPNLGRPEKR